MERVHGEKVAIDSTKIRFMAATNLARIQRNSTSLALGLLNMVEEESLRALLYGSVHYHGFM
jgi:hypothetical protein